VLSTRFYLKNNLAAKIYHVDDVPATGVVLRRPQTRCEVLGIEQQRLSAWIVPNCCGHRSDVVDGWSRRVPTRIGLQLSGQPIRVDGMWTEYGRAQTTTALQKVETQQRREPRSTIRTSLQVQILTFKFLSHQQQCRSNCFEGRLHFRSTV